MIITRSISGKVYENNFFIVKDGSDFSQLMLEPYEQEYIDKKLKESMNFIDVNRIKNRLFISTTDIFKKQEDQLEKGRRVGNELAILAKYEKLRTIHIICDNECGAYSLAVVEGIVLGSYQFLKYFSQPEKMKSNLEEICITAESISDRQLEELAALMEAVTSTRDLINEPVVNLNAEKLSETFVEMALKVGANAKVLFKKEIEELKFGGLLAVNKGSVDPPTFTILEWKPANAVNEKPVILIGKGVVFDTGGLTLKPTSKSMDYMKSDMAGGAAVASTLCYIARIKLPIHLIAMIPATDNRPSGNAITPGDVVTISNGTTVEVLNTDAEGRLILADALCYAKNYNPMLVIDIATLTGSAAMTVGSHGIISMRSEMDGYYEILKQSGEKVHERLVELPLWDEYDEMIKSSIADIKNIGGGEAGAITAGKFLQKFIQYPWIHLDIAGAAFLNSANHYRVVGGTAVGVRLLSDFLTELTIQLSSESNNKKFPKLSE